MPTSTNPYQFGRCYRCKKELRLPPIKIPLLDQIQWSDQPGQVEVNYAPYCERGGCLEGALKGLRRALKRKGFQIDGDPIELPEELVEENTEEHTEEEDEDNGN